MTLLPKRWLRSFLLRRFDLVHGALYRRERLRRIWFADQLASEQYCCQKFESRTQSLEPALAECVTALRKIASEKVSGDSPGWKTRKNIAVAVLDRIQIPDDCLPTKGYSE